MPSSTKPRTYFFKKVPAAELNFVHISLILTKVFSQQQLMLMFYDRIMPNTLIIVVILIMNCINRPELFKV